MLLIYSEHITPRISYIFSFMLAELAGFEIKLTHEKDEYLLYDGPSINYSSQKVKQKEIFVKPNGLLFSNSVIPMKGSVQKKEDDILFYLKGENIDHNIFDPFAAAFYLITRYEEYLPFTPDQFNRFEAKSSILYEHGLLEQPLINKWALALQKEVLINFPQINFHVKKFAPLVTIDIDQAYAFKHKGLGKNILSFSKNLLLNNKEMLAKQVNLLFDEGKDPYDSYEYLGEIQKNTGVSFLYFVNIGAYSKYDKNLSPKNKALKTLLRKINSYANIGMHPSYYSNEVTSKFFDEKKQLESILNRTITKSRQHYLKLLFPRTYKKIIELGITEDYSMGFACSPGFRAATCTPFYWFDLEENSVTALKIFPTTYMEGTFIEDLEMSPQEAQARIFALIDTVKKYNGCHVSIWHNHTVSDQFYWKNWRSVFENSLQKLKEWN